MSATPPIKEHPSMSLVQKTISLRKQALLDCEVGSINAFLSAFRPLPSGRRRAVLDSSKEFIRVLGFPLPGGYHPPSADMVIIVTNFPTDPPYGLYLLNSAKAQVDKIEALFGRPHVMRRATPEAIPGYTWICYHYSGGWIYRPEAPAKGDNLAKFLRSFAGELQAGTRR
jgi:hypothetical protein